MSPNGNTRWLDEAQSPPLCGDDQRGRPQAQSILEPGALLVFYSDGLIERRGELLTDRLDLLKSVAASMVGLSPTDVCDRLVVALGVEASRQDDVAVLAVQFNPLAGGGFHLVFPAKPDELQKLRTSLRDWLEGRDLGAATRHALILAIGEACSNAIEHAYTGALAGDVKVEIEETADSMLTVTVRDHGRLRTPSHPGADRGLGTALMRDLTVGFRRDSNPTGTTVRFRLPMSAQA